MAPRHRHRPHAPRALPFLLAALVPRARGGTAPQNMCGASYGDALACGAACPSGTGAECPTGQTCFAEVECPLPPTLSPRPTRSPVPGFRLGNHDKEIIGYYASWQWYDRSKLAKPANMDFAKVTRVNYAFFQLNAEGDIWGTDEWADPRLLYGDVTGPCTPGAPLCRCSWVEPGSKSCSYHKDGTGIVAQVHRARRDIYPSIGGWTLSDAFPPMAAGAATRRNFARNCRDLIVDYDFDGIDLDWEYPGYADHSGTPADTENFSLLLRDLREELDALGEETGRSYGLTAALPCGPGNIDNINVGTAARFLTEFNLMSYDFHGAWNEVTGVNSPLYDGSGDEEPGWSVAGCVDNWVKRGAPRERLNIGLGFYGRSFRDAKGLGVAHGGTDDMSWELDEGSPQYFNVMDQTDIMSVQWDDESKTPYAFFTDRKGGVVSYDDERSICLKTEYAYNQDLLGFIIWELSGDVMEDLSTPLLDMVNRKLSEPDTNCADPYGPKLPPQLPPVTTTVVPEVITTTTERPPVTTTVVPEVTTTTTELPVTTTVVPEVTTTTTELPPVTTTVLSEVTTTTVERPPVTTTVVPEVTTTTTELPVTTTVVPEDTTTTTELPPVTTTVLPEVTTTTERPPVTTTVVPEVTTTTTELLVTTTVVPEDTTTTTEPPPVTTTVLPEVTTTTERPTVTTTVVPEVTTMTTGRPLVAFNAKLEAEEEVEEMHGREDNAAKTEKEDLETLAEELIEATFPPGCSWQCYLANHPRLAKRIEHTEAAALDHWINRKKAIRWDCTCNDGTLIEGKSQPELEEEVINAVIDIEEDIDELESKDIKAAKVEKEDLEILEEKLIEATFPPGCYWQCYLANHPRLAKKIENTKEAALDHWMNGRQKGVKWDCTCKEGTLIEGKSQPELEEEVINAMIDIEEELEGKDNNAAKIEKEDLEPLATELVEPAFPSGCYWECFLANHPRLKKRIDYTEEAALDHWVNRKKGIRWDCTCKEGMMIERNPQPESTGEVVNAIIEIEEDIKEFEQEKTREQKKKEKLEKREQNQQAKRDKQKQRGEMHVMGYVSGTPDMTPMSGSDKGYKFVNKDEVHVYVDDDERRRRRHLRHERQEEERH